MDLEKIRGFCLSKKDVSESFPFNEDTLVFKVSDKMFCLLNMIFPYSINIKCDPKKADELREMYEAVKPGYHMNKKHWNTIELDNSIADVQILEWINDSYNLVVNSLPVKQKKNLRN